VRTICSILLTPTLTRRRCFVCFYVQIWTRRLHGWYCRGKWDRLDKEFFFFSFLFFSFLHLILSSSSGLTGYQGFARLEGGRLILRLLQAFAAAFAVSSLAFLYHIYSALYPSVAGLWSRGYTWSFIASSFHCTVLQSHLRC
jgi:hypothetical protein